MQVAVDKIELAEQAQAVGRRALIEVAITIVVVGGLEQGVILLFHTVLIVVAHRVVSADLDISIFYGDSEGLHGTGKPGQGGRQK